MRPRTRAAGRRGGRRRCRRPRGSLRVATLVLLPLAAAGPAGAATRRSQRSWLAQRAGRTRSARRSPAAEPSQAEPCASFAAPPSASSSQLESSAGIRLRRRQCSLRRRDLRARRADEARGRARDGSLPLRSRFRAVLAGVAPFRPASRPGLRTGRRRRLWAGFCGVPCAVRLLAWLRPTRLCAHAWLLHLGLRVQCSSRWTRARLASGWEGREQRRQRACLATGPASGRKARATDGCADGHGVLIVGRSPADTSADCGASWTKAPAWPPDATSRVDTNNCSVRSAL